MKWTKLYTGADDVKGTVEVGNLTHEAVIEVWYAEDLDFDMAVMDDDVKDGIECGRYVVYNVRVTATVGMFVGVYVMGEYIAEGSVNIRECVKEYGMDRVALRDLFVKMYNAYKLLNGIKE